MSSSTSKFTTETEVPISAVQSASSPFSIRHAPSQRYRFLDIPCYLDHQTLKVVSASTLPLNKYICLSFVWSGFPLNSTAPSIFIDGLTSNPSYNVPIEGLRIVCTAARHFGYEYLWMDKFCVRQDEYSDEEDKPWQVGQMYTIYSGCGVCVVMPGGLARLSELEEKTTWIERAWTLQEALAPKDVRVLFKWTKGPSLLRHNSAAFVEVVEPGVGSGELKGLLECSLKGSVRITPTEGSFEWTDAPSTRVGLFATETESSFPAIALLAAIDHEMATGRLNAIWRALIIRGSKYKEDLIFGSMGIMGAVIDGQDIKKGSNYNDEEVTRLLIKFVMKLVDKGSKADWLGLAPELGPAKLHSGLPAMPLNYNVGEGFYVEDSKYKPVKAKVSAIRFSWWWLNNAPGVVVDATGDVSMNVKAIPAEQVVEGRVQTLADHEILESCSGGQKWVIQKDKQDPKSFAVVVGTKEIYTNGIASSFVDNSTTLVMLVKEIADGKYRNVGYAWAEKDIETNWETRKFVVGG